MFVEDSIDLQIFKSKFFVKDKCERQTTMLFRFLFMVHVCVAFPLKCPEPAQWSLRARSHCHDASKYFCLRNDLINGYSENCTVFDFLQPGRKNVLRGGLDADVCSLDRYQPWPLTYYTNVSTNCIFLKATCNEEGQVVHDKGNRNTDITCKCDYTKGYDFLVKPRNPCFCIPSEEDCSCFLKHALIQLLNFHQIMNASM
ncbi:unnamed protein product [Mytilus edulis]|uniref:Uncharacterized protein n=1 Tax=Mytilus edulis TaxID=6550 RepID=A0A8S3QG05_MYTED|nr:unnamed protein product [Mytilus edulis]